MNGGFRDQAGRFKAAVLEQLPDVIEPVVFVSRLGFRGSLEQT